MIQWRSYCCSKLVLVAALEICLGWLYTVRVSLRWLFVVASLRHLASTCTRVDVVVQVDWVRCVILVDGITIEYPNVGLFSPLVIQLSRILGRTYLYHIQSLISCLCRSNLLHPSIRISLMGHKRIGWSQIHPVHFVALCVVNFFKYAFMIKWWLSFSLFDGSWSRFGLRLCWRSWCWSSLMPLERFSSCCFGHLFKWLAFLQFYVFIILLFLCFNLFYFKATTLCFFVCFCFGVDLNVNYSFLRFRQRYIIFIFKLSLRYLGITLTHLSQSLFDIFGLLILTCHWYSWNRLVLAWRYNLLI